MQAQVTTEQTINPESFSNDAQKDMSDTKVFTNVNGQSGTLGTMGTSINPINTDKTPPEQSSLQELARKFGKKIGQ